MIDTDRTRLRHWLEKDIQALTELRNNVSVQSKLLARVRGSSPEDTRLWLEHRSDNQKDLLLIIADKNTDSLLGYIVYTGVDVVDKVVSLGICLSSEIQRKGIGTEVLLSSMEYLQRYWDTRKVILEVSSLNVTAIKCYEKAGFVYCGKYEKHKYIDGSYQDVILMEKFLL